MNNKLSKFNLQSQNSINCFVLFLDNSFKYLCYSSEKVNLTMKNNLLIFSK